MTQAQQKWPGPTPEEAGTLDDSVRILLACMPKSGSTFLSAALAALPGMRREGLVAKTGRREQELCLLALRQAERRTAKLRRDGETARGYVAQRHVRRSEATEEIIAAFGLRPVLLLRTLFDVVPSLADHIRARGTSLPFAFVPEEARGWPDGRLHAFLADMVLPWYFNFALTWEGAPGTLVLTYDRVTAEPEAALADIAAHAGLPVTEAEIAAAIATARGGETRFNRGISGRGEALAPEVRARIRALAAWYPGADFSALGL